MSGLNTFDDLDLLAGVEELCGEEIAADGDDLRDCVVSRDPEDEDGEAVRLTLEKADGEVFEARANIAMLRVLYAEIGGLLRWAGEEG